MYLVLPFLFLIASGRNAYSRMMSLLAGFSFIGWLVQYLTGHANILAYIPCFIAGVLAYVKRDSRPFLPAWLWIPALILWFVLLDYAALQTAGVYSVLTWIATAVLGLSIFCFRQSNSLAWNRICETVARYSYGIYLLHVPVMWLVFDVFHVSNLILGTMCWLAGTFAVAALAYFTVEEPLIRAGKQLAGRVGKSVRREAVAAGAA